MPGIPSEDACFFGGTPRNYALTMKLLTVLWADYDMIQANMKCEWVKWKYGKYSKMPEINMKQL